MAEKTPAQAAAEAKDKLKKDAEVSKNIRAELFQKVLALIPNKISNATVINAFEALRAEQKLLRKDFSSHLKTNAANILKHDATTKKTDGYVEDQNAWTDVAYGDATMQYSGCEIFATWNALRNLAGQSAVKLADMIAAYEKDGMVFSGKFGTAPKAIVEYLQKLGYKAELTTEEMQFDALGQKSDSLILTMYNDKDDISAEVHTVNISKENGKFTAHNVYCNGKVVGPYSSVSEVIGSINKGRAKGISLIGINKKK